MKNQFGEIRRESTISVVSLGCKLNQEEAESVAFAFSKEGFASRCENVSASSPVDEGCLLCVLFTCTVTEKADRKVRRTANLLLKKKPGALLILTGCAAACDGGILESLDGRVVCLGREEKSAILSLPAALHGVRSQDDARSALEDLRKRWRRERFGLDAFSFFTPQFSRHSRPSLKIQDGCDEFCSYCRTRLARGRSASLSPEETLRRVSEFESDGHAEVVLAGVHTSGYRADGADGKVFSFADLLEYLLENTQKISFRLSSLHPEDIDEKICALAKEPRIRPHFHISLQSGSDAVLKKMLRRYDARKVLEAVLSLRDARRDAFFACDVIAGFPNETAADFEATMQLCRDCQFAWIHAFEFSPRPGTAAFSMPRVADGCEIKKRCAAIRALAIEQKREYCRRQTARRVSAVIEKYRDELRAVTENYLHVKIISAASNPYELGGGEARLVLERPCEICGRDGEIEMLARFDDGGL